MKFSPFDGKLFSQQHKEIIFSQMPSLKTYNSITCYKINILRPENCDKTVLVVVHFVRPHSYILTAIQNIAHSLT